MNIEKVLKKYLDNKGNKIKYNTFFQYAKDSTKKTIEINFKLVNNEIDSMSDSKNLDRTVEVLKYIEVIIGYCDDVNRQIVKRKIIKLQEKISRIFIEKKANFKKKKKVTNEFNKVRRELDMLAKMNKERNTKQYSFIEYLVEEAKNIEYLEYAIKNSPALVNVKDKNEVPLFRNLIINYLKCIKEDNESDLLYYNHLISVIMSQDNFKITEIEKRKCLEEVYKCVNKLSINKKSQKKNSKKLQLLSQLVNTIKSMDQNKLPIDEIASKYNISINFNEELIEKAKLAKVPSTGEMTGREEIKDYIISIDGISAVEIDDALSCRKLSNGNYLLGVHIASVLGYFPYESDMIQEAIKRNQSIYLPHKYQSKEHDFNRTIPMFPYAFCADKASLKEGEKRLARSYYFEIDKNGDVVNQKFLKTIITNNKQLTYDNANDILKHGTDNEKLQETIDNLSEVTKILDIRYATSDLYEKIKESVSDYSELRVKKVGAENIVYQSMLLTGNKVADYFAEHGYPLLYRVHYVNEQDLQKLESMINNLNETYKGNQFKNLYQLIYGIYPKGWYAEEGCHSGLELDHYCHCTSALRRASDIIVEHALEVCHDQNPTEDDLKKLQAEIAEKVIIINERTSPIDYFIKEYQKKHRYK